MAQRSTGTKPGGRQRGHSTNGSKPKPRTGSGSGRGGRRKARRSTRLVPWLAVGLVVAVAGTLVVIKATGKARPADQSSVVPASIMASIAGIPGATFDAAGVAGDLRPPTTLPASTEPLTSGGLPHVVYIGAEYCPFCAAERWPLVVALSRFGTFSGLRASESSTIDVFPGTKTFSFYGSTYQSQYVVFTGVELQTNRPAAGGGYEPLEEMTADQQALMAAFDRPPYTDSAGAIPFLDLGNRYVLVGSTYDPTVLQGLSVAEITQGLSDPSSPVGSAVLGSANLLTAAICQATGGQPGNVCTSPAVAQAQARLGQTG